MFIRKVGYGGLSLTMGRILGKGTSPVREVVAIVTNKELHQGRKASQYVQTQRLPGEV